MRPFASVVTRSCYFYFYSSSTFNFLHGYPRAVMKFRRAFGQVLSTLGFDWLAIERSYVYFAT